MPRYKSDDLLDDPDSVPRPVMAIGADIATGPGAFRMGAHHHRKAQLIYTARGMLTCEVSRGLWSVPPGCALWIPGGAMHSVTGVGNVEVYALFVDPASVDGLPRDCCTMSVSPLLREVLLRCVEFPALYPVDGRESRVAAVLLDELAAAPVEKLHLPMPSDGRLRKIADQMASEPSDRASVNDWARRIGVSERTLGRLVVQETGMSFGRWRQQLHISLALQWLSRGAPVQQVATDLGYESASSFVFMFRKVLGTSPARYMTQRRAESATNAGKEPGY